MRVFVYRNLNRKGWVWSIKAVEGPHKDLVLGYAPILIINDAQFKVSEAGRQRVLKQLRKNVHAGVVGELVHVENYVARHQEIKLIGSTPQQYKNAELITYNPYKYQTFVVKNNKTPIYNSQAVLFYYDEVRAYNF